MESVLEDEDLLGRALPPSFRTIYDNLHMSLKLYKTLYKTKYLECSTLILSLVLHLLEVSEDGPEKALGGRCHGDLELMELVL